MGLLNVMNTVHFGTLRPPNSHHPIAQEVLPLKKSKKKESQGHQSSTISYFPTSNRASSFVTVSDFFIKN